MFLYPRILKPSVIISQHKFLMTNIAIFASGSGSNAQKIVEYLADFPQLKVGIILTNNAQAGVIQRAEKLKIPVHIFDRTAYKSGGVLDILKKKNIDWVILAGFLWLIPKSFIEIFPQKIINLHPALLPEYGGKGMYGHFVHEAVVANHESESGITIHYVNEYYDEGAIIFQAKFEILPNDTALDIAAKGQKLEHQFFPKVIVEEIQKNG